MVSKWPPSCEYPDCKNPRLPQNYVVVDFGDRGKHVVMVCGEHEQKGERWKRSMCVTGAPSPPLEGLKAMKMTANIEGSTL